MLTKGEFLSQMLVRLGNLPYICNVFFMVLELRLTKIGCRDDNQFFHFKLFRFSSILSLIYYPRHSIRNKQWSIFFK